MLFSVHLKATMMKVSDPIIFGHAVRAYFADVFAAARRGARRRVGVNPNDGLGALLTGDRGAPGRRARRDPRGDRRRLRERPGARDGRLRPRDHEPARPQRRDHRRLDARGDPRLRPDVERRRRAAGHEVRDPRPLLRAALRRDGRPLPRARRVRPGDDGHDPERRADGAGRRGVRLARQDVRDRGRRARPRRRRRRRRRCSSTTVEAGDIWRMCQTKDAAIRDWVRLAVARARATGCAGGVLARRGPRPRRGAAARRSARRSSELDTDGLADRDPGRRRPPRGSRSSARAAARTRSRSPATCCATTSPTCSRSSSSGTSAKMLSIVPLMNGGGLFETGAGGSAPKHVQQFLAGEPPALGLARRVPRAGAVARAAGRQGRQPARRGCSRGRSTARPAGCSRRTARRRAAPASSTTAAATSTSRSTGRRSSPTRTRTPSSPRGSPRSPSASRRDEETIVARAGRGPGLAGRHRRLLPPGSRADGRGDAAERDAQRGARVLNG